MRAHQKLSNQVVAAYDQMVRYNLPVGQCNEKQVETRISG